MTDSTRGMGLAGAPATESMMGALPSDRAGIGSAVNNTTRELGGALGVAVVGTVVSSLYSNHLALPRGTPARPVGAVVAWRYLPARAGERPPFEDNRVIDSAAVSAPAM